MTTRPTIFVRTCAQRSAVLNGLLMTDRLIATMSRPVATSEAIETAIETRRLVESSLPRPSSPAAPVG